MNDFNAYKLDEWVKDGLTLPSPKNLPNEEKRKNPAPWVVGIAASVAFAFSSTLLVNSGESADVQTEKVIVAGAAHEAIDTDLIVGPPSEFWSRAMRDVRTWKSVSEDEGDEPPSVI